MRYFAALVVLLILLPTADAQTRVRRRASGTPAAPVAAQTSVPDKLPLRRVILYSNGVAYFERRGTVSGRAEINLSFKQSQVDDVLKSLVVLDLGKGRIGAVSYNSSAPPSARLNEIPFSIEAGADGSEGGLPGVLRQLQGARVVVATADRTATGAILNVAERKSPDDKKQPPAVAYSLIIAAESGELQSFDLTEVRSVKLLDEGARHDVNEFANASAYARRRDSKNIVVTSDGEGQREMIVSYTVAAPIWKTSYRVVLDEAGKPFFQGWAIVDNVSEEDWQNVQLSLVSGTPISFIQPVQQPLYRHRPVISLPDDVSLDPQKVELGGEKGIGYGRGAGEGSGAGVAPPPPPKPVPSESVAITTQQIQSLPNMSANSSNFANLAAGVAVPRTSLSNAMTGGNSGVEAVASGNEVGDLFEYRIEQPVTVLRDRSALIPILQARLEGERVALYNEGQRKDRPMSSIRLKNVSPLTLEGGALTVVDGDAYAGEALMDRLKPNEQKFISFALDLGTLVTARLQSERRPVFLVRAAKGVFETHYYQTQKKSYTVTNQTDRQRVVYLEHPVRSGWELSDDTPKPASRTASFYRFRVELAPRATAELAVTETQALMDSYQLSNLTRRDVELFVSSRYIDAATRAELEKLVDLKTRLAAIDARLEAAEKEGEEIGQDQKRLRENIDKLKGTPEARQLIARYVAKADQQETRIEQLDKERKAAGDERAKLQAELEAAIRAFALDRKL